MLKFQKKQSITSQNELESLAKTGKVLNIDELEQDDHIEAQHSKTIVHVVAKVRILVFHPLNGWVPGMPLSRCVEVEEKPMRKHLIDPEVDKELEGYSWQQLRELLYKCVLPEQTLTVHIFIYFKLIQIDEWSINLIKMTKLH